MPCPPAGGRLLPAAQAHNNTRVLVLTHVTERDPKEQRSEQMIKQLVALSSHS